jgi:hypothetical protein
VASRKEQKERLRQERREREEAAAAAAQRKRVVGIGAAAVLVVAAVVAIVLVALNPFGGDDGSAQSGQGATISWPDGGEVPEQPGNLPSLADAAEAAGCRVVNPQDEGNQHVETPVTYRANPPTSGNHNPIPADDGVYESAPATENLVHTQEHGRIVIQVRPGALSEDQLAQLKAFYDEDPYHMVLTPNGTRMRPALAVTTWNHALLCDRVSDRTFTAISAFKEEYRDKGPEFVP